MVYAWCLDRMAHAPKEEFEAWHEELFAPPAGVDPDHVTQDVIEDEMSMFHRINVQNMGGGA